ncbi:hypothetical protein PENTCL1PPCAC_26963, partial [Pristionchus entomophagus]
YYSSCQCYHWNSPLPSMRRPTRLRWCLALLFLMEEALSGDTVDRLCIYSPFTLYCESSSCIQSETTSYKRRRSFFLSMGSSG